LVVGWPPPTQNPWLRHWLPMLFSLTAGLCQLYDVHLFISSTILVSSTSCYPPLQALPFNTFTSTQNQ